MADPIKPIDNQPAVSVVKIDRPRIHLIHAKAQRRLDQYIQRTRLSGRGIRTFHDLDYCYDKENFHPLGLRLFQTKIRVTATSDQFAVTGDGQRFLLIQSTENETKPLSVILNWQALLRN